METILVKPKNKEELELVCAMLKRMDIRFSINRKDSIKKKKDKKNLKK